MRALLLLPLSLSLALPRFNTLHHRWMPGLTACPSSREKVDTKGTLPAHLMWLQVDDVRETWLLVKVEQNTDLVEVRGHLCKRGTIVC